MNPSRSTVRSGAEEHMFWGARLDVLIFRQRSYHVLISYSAECIGQSFIKHCCSEVRLGRSCHFRLDVLRQSVLRRPILLYVHVATTWNDHDAKDNQWMPWYVLLCPSRYSYGSRFLCPPAAYTTTHNWSTECSWTARQHHHVAMPTGLVPSQQPFGKWELSRWVLCGSRASNRQGA